MHWLIRDAPTYSHPSDFNLDFYTEVQDLSYLENALSATATRFKELNLAICELVEDFGLVGFETLAVEVRAPAVFVQARLTLYTGQAFNAAPDTRH